MAEGFNRGFTHTGSQEIMAWLACAALSRHMTVSVPTCNRRHCTLSLTAHNCRLSAAQGWGGRQPGRSPQDQTPHVKKLQAR